MFENRVDSKLTDYEHFWWFQFQDFNAGWRLIVSSAIFPPSVAMFQMLPLVESFKPVVTEIDEFEWRDFSKLGVSLAFSDYQDCNRSYEFNNGWIDKSTRKPEIAISLLEFKCSGYGERVGGIDKKLSKSLEVVWHSWTKNIQIQRTICLLLAAKLSLQLKICRFSFSWRKSDW